MFGLVAAVGTTVLTMIISGIGVWYGGWLDELIQRITEVNLILPVLPILIMIGTFYNRSIWTMLGVIILLGIFGGAIKTNRAIFLQVKQSPYIEAAQAYGAGNARIIFSYLIPRIIPLLIPAFVIQIPAWVTRPSPPGGRSSTMPARTAPFSAVYTTGFWNLLRC
jgi:peptide/nickel transport system permease protein